MRRAEFSAGLKMLGLAGEVIGQVIAGGGIGWLIDWWLGQEYVWVTVGAGVGVLTGLVTLVRGAWKLNSMLERTAPTRGRGTPLTDEDFQEQDDDED